MKLKDIKEGTNINLEEVEVVSKTVKEIKTKYGLKKVGNYMIKDSDDNMILFVIWETKTVNPDLIEVGDVLDVTNCYTNKFQDKIQVVYGRESTIRKL